MNCRAYRITALCDPFPQKRGVGLKGTRMAFSNIDIEGIEEQLIGEYVKILLAGARE